MKSYHSLFFQITSLLLFTFLYVSCSQGDKVFDVEVARDIVVVFKSNKKKGEKGKERIVEFMDSIQTNTVAGQHPDMFQFAEWLKEYVILTEIEEIKAFNQAVINEVDFATMNPFVQTYFHTNLAGIYYSEKRFVECLEKVKLNIELLEEQPEVFEQELAMSYMNVAILSYECMHKDEEVLKILQKSNKLLKKVERHSARVICLSNMVDVTTNMGKYEWAKAYGLEADQLNEEKAVGYESALAEGMYSPLLQSLYELGEIDEAKAIIRKLDDYYKNGDVSLHDYYAFNVYSLESMLKMGLKDEFLLRGDSAKHYAEKNNKDYLLAIYHKAMAEYAKTKNDIPASKKSYVQSLQYLEDKQDRNSIDLQKECLDSLIALEVSGKKTPIKNWVNQKEKLHDLANDATYASQLDYFSKKELEKEKNQRYLRQKEQEIHDTRIRFFTISSIVILSLSLLLLRLYRIVRKKNRELVSQKEILVQQNNELDAQKSEIKYQAGLISQQNLELARLIGRLEESNEDLKNFASVAAHDLNAPLRTIAQFSKYLKKKYLKDIPEKDADLFDFIYDSCQQLKDIIDGLLLFSGITKNLGTPKPVNIHNMLFKVGRQLQASLENRNAQFNIPDTTIPPVKGHENLINQLLLNLVNNGMKFSKPDVPPVVDVLIEDAEQEGWVKIGVQDNGIGIPKEKCKDIFSMFNRLHNKEQYKGAGIGLATCKRIVGQYGGDIWVESEVGVGSTFYFTLPLYE